MKTLLGCLVLALFAILVGPFLVLAFAISGFDPPSDIAGSGDGWMYETGQGGKPTLSDLGFGSSNAQRVNRMIEAINPNSPLAGHGDQLVKLGKQWKIDPLLIAQWQFETSMATTGVNAPFNGGNMTWPAAQEASELYGCHPGPSSLGHDWAKCSSMKSGLNLWFDYIHTYFVKKKGITGFKVYANTYNPCSDPANRGRFTCGTGYADAILALINQTAGAPSVSGGYQTGGGSTISSHCPPEPRMTLTVNGVPYASATVSTDYARKHKAIRHIVDTAVGRDNWTVVQGWGPSGFPGEVSWEGFDNFHVGEDINFSGDDNQPAYAIDDGVATPVTWPDGNHTEYLTLRNGITWRYLHFQTQVAKGKVRKGDVMGRIGSTGNSRGPHLHLEMSQTYRDSNWLWPGQWACRFRKES